MQWIVPNLITRTWNYAGTIHDFGGTMQWNYTVELWNYACVRARISL